MNWFEAINVAILVLFIVTQAHISTLAILSWQTLRQYTFSAQHGRLTSILRSDATPGVSIIMPAYNEAAGIVESVRSMAMLHYPRFEIIVVNDGSADETFASVVEAFRMQRSLTPIRLPLPVSEVQGVYESTLPIPVRLVDKVNGGKGDAVNAGLCVARYEHVMVTDADTVIEEEAVLRAMRHFVEDRERTVAVGGNIRPINGCVVRRGKVVRVALPRRLLERAQILEYLRSFLAARPAWSDLGALVLVSGAFGVFLRDSIIDSGGFKRDHLGEDLELTMRLQHHGRLTGGPSRVVYAHDAVAWTEVPSSSDILRKQRLRWHRGLIQVLWEYRSTLLNPRHGAVGMLGWPSYVVFEFLAPIFEVAGWVVVPVSLILGLVNPGVAVPLFLIAITIGVLNSISSLLLDERFGHYRDHRMARTLLAATLLEQLGTRQRTVWWRFRSMFWRRDNRDWGDMERAGVGNLS